MYRVHELIVVVCAHGHVVFNANDITLMIFIDLIRAIVVVLARDSMKIPTAIQYCEV